MFFRKKCSLYIYYRKRSLSPNSIDFVDDKVKLKGFVCPTISAIGHHIYKSLSSGITSKFSPPSKKLKGKRNDPVHLSFSDDARESEYVIFFFYNRLDYVGCFYYSSDPKGFVVNGSDDDLQYPDDNKTDKGEDDVFVSSDKKSLAEKYVFYIDVYHRLSSDINRQTHVISKNPKSCIAYLHDVPTRYDSFIMISYSLICVQYPFSGC